MMLKLDISTYIDTHELGRAALFKILITQDDVPSKVHCGGLRELSDKQRYIFLEMAH
jgi:hypothetical protein